jgi:hypothetical protein
MKTDVPEVGLADIFTEKFTKPSTATGCVPDPVQDPVVLIEQVREAALENTGVLPEEAGANRVVIVIVAPPLFPTTHALKFCRVQAWCTRVNGHPVVVQESLVFWPT